MESGFRRGLRLLRGGVGVALRCPEGGAGGWSPADLATVVPDGGLAFLVARLPFYFSLLSFPHPPDPLPLRGRGRLKVILCKGLRPLHPRGLTRAAQAFLVESGFRRGGLRLLRGGVRGGIAVPGGGRRGVVACRPCLAGTRRGGAGGWSPACPFTLSYFLSPIPPTPFPAGRGRLKVILCKGLRPLHPRGLTRAARAFLVESEFRRGFASCGAGWGWRCDARRGGAGGVVACRPCRFGIRWGACFPCRPPALLL